MDGSLLHYLGVKMYVFVACFGALMLVNFWVVYSKGKPKLKRNVFVALVILTTALFLANAPKQNLFFIAPFVIAIAIFNLVQYRICDACGKLFNRKFFAKPQRCPSCGVELGPK